jgi:hypothetical protein
VEVLVWHCGPEQADRRALLTLQLLTHKKGDTDISDLEVHSRQLSVCLVSFTGYPDQGATYFFEMARSLARLGQHVTVIAVQRPSEQANDNQDAVHIMRIPATLTTNWASPLRWANKFWFLVRAAARIRKQQFDIIHAYTTVGACILPLLGRRDFHSKWVHEIQSGAVSSRSSLARKVQDRATVLQGLAFDANLAVTQTLAERLFGKTASRVDVVPAGVNLSHFRPDLTCGFRGEMGIPPRAIVFVHAGVVGAERRTDVPLRAFARALSKVIVSGS